MRALLTVPPELLAQLATHEIQAFGQFIFVTQDAEYDQFESLASTLGADGVLTVELPVELFTDRRSEIAVTMRSS